MNVGIIPARLNSTRLSEKILIPIGGMPMVVQVYRQALKAKKLDKVIVAMDDEKTQAELTKFSVSGIMTSKFHRSGTDRIAEAMNNEDTDVVVNIQADEPEIEPELIDDLIVLFENSDTEMGTAVTSDLTRDDLENPDVVKVKIDEKGMAVNFSRQPMTGNRIFRHIGIYAFKTYVLEKFVQLPLSNREKEKKLEQMRALDNGIPICTIITDYKGRGIDNIGDVKRLETQYDP